MLESFLWFVGGAIAFGFLSKLIGLYQNSKLVLVARIKLLKEYTNISNILFHKLAILLAASEESMKYLCKENKDCEENIEEGIEELTNFVTDWQVNETRYMQDKFPEMKFAYAAAFKDYYKQVKNKLTQFTK